MPYDHHNDYPAPVRERAARVRLACFDVDGTLTDGRLLFDTDGRELKAFHVHDGLGMVLLRQAGIETADVVCAVTQNDNINIMVAQIAGHVFSVPRVITRIFNPGSRPVFESFGLEAICSTELTVQAFLRSIHREQEIKQERLFSRTVHYSRVPISPEVVGEPVANLATEAGRLIFGVLRAGELLLADPGLKVEAGDELVLAELH